MLSRLKFYCYLQRKSHRRFMNVDKRHIKNMKSSQSLTIFIFLFASISWRVICKKNFKQSDGTKYLDIKRIQLYNATRILHVMHLKKMLTRVAKVPLNVRNSSLSLSRRKIPERPKPLVNLWLANFEFPYQRNYILQLDIM